MIHVDQKHGLKMASKSSQLTLAALLVVLATGGAMAPAVLAQVANIAMTSAYTIEFEKEADSMGLDALIKSGYSPTAMVTVMESFMHEEMKQPIIEYGIYMDHPESIERVETLSKKLVSHKITLQRKYPLHLLHTSLKETGDSVALWVDDTEICRGPLNVKQALEHSKRVLDADFQMELAPYDLQLNDDKNVLRLKNSVLAEAPLTNLAAFRENLLTALARAQKRHPIAKYFR